VNQAARYNELGLPYSAWDNSSNAVSVDDVESDLQQLIRMHAEGSNYILIVWLVNTFCIVNHALYCSFKTTE
jgi:hypothetical protein